MQKARTEKQTWMTRKIHRSVMINVSGNQKLSPFRNSNEDHPLERSGGRTIKAMERLLYNGWVDGPPLIWTWPKTQWIRLVLLLQRKEEAQRLNYPGHYFDFAWKGTFMVWLKNFKYIHPTPIWKICFCFQHLSISYISISSDSPFWW